jgi:hypothetical protein
MKNFLILFVSISCLSWARGQTCGIYRIKYVGTIQSETFLIQKVQLPTISFLEFRDSSNRFIEITPANNVITTEIRSPLTTPYSDAEILLNRYKSKQTTIPIILSMTKNGQEKQITIEMSWDNITITRLNDGKFGSLFEINLHEIKVDR